MKAEPELVTKWEDRAVEWHRLAGLAADPHIAGICQDHAVFSSTMARFWRGQ
jgi:hypothetical protein